MPKGFGKSFEHPGAGKSKAEKPEEIIELEGSEDEPLELLEPFEDVPLTMGEEKFVPKPRYRQEDLPFDERESFQKVAAFGYKKGLKNGIINVLSDGSYILEFLDKKGERQEMYYFDKGGNLTQFRDPKYDMKEMKDLAGKINKSLQKMNDLMIEMLETDTVYSKIIKH